MEDCLICKNSFNINELIKLSCNHTYCKFCFKSWYLKNQTKCCFCLKIFKFIEYIHLFELSELPEKLLNTIIEDAIETNNKKILKKIIKYTETDYLMMSAIRKGNLRIVKYLYSIGIKPTFRCVEIACYYTGNLKLLKYLHLIGCEFTDRTILIAIKYGDIKLVKYLHSIGIEITQKSIEYACDNGDLNLVKFLLRNGCCITYETVICSRRSGNKKLVNFLTRENRA